MAVTTNKIQWKDVRVCNCAGCKRLLLGKHNPPARELPAEAAKLQLAWRVGNPKRPYCMRCIKAGKVEE